MKKSFFIFVVFCIQCAFGITLEEVANKKFWEVGKMVDPNDTDFVLAKPQDIKKGTLVIKVFLTRCPTLEPNMLEINTKEKIITTTFFADGTLKEKFELDDFRQDGDKLIFNYDKDERWILKWLDKKKGLLLRIESGVGEILFIDIEYLLKKNLPIPPIVVYDMSDLQSCKL